jgi:hypothetical protein
MDDNPILRWPYVSQAAMAAESCHPRGLSCKRGPASPPTPPATVKLPVPVPFMAPNAEDPEPEPPIGGLLDELLLDILAYVPRASLPSLPAVCRCFTSLLVSQTFL